MPTKQPYEYMTDEELIYMCYEHLRQALRAAHEFDFKRTYDHMIDAYRKLKARVLAKNEIRRIESGESADDEQS